MSSDRVPGGLVDLYAEVGRKLAGASRTVDAVTAVAELATTIVPGVQWASVTRGKEGRFRTLTATDRQAQAVDDIQYELNSGPCVDAILQGTTFRTGDLEADERWPEFSRRATGATEVRSMLSFRLFMEEDGDVISGLNLYSTEPDAFDDSAVAVGTVLAAHGALAVSAAAAREHVAQLERALRSSRDIGVAMGVLMASHRITRDQAFDLLRIASQHSNRRLADLALDVVETGALELPDDDSRSPQG